MKNQKVNFLEKEEFNKFYHEVAEVALSAKANPGKGNVTIEQLMEQANLVFDIDPLIKDSVTPALSANLYAPSKAAFEGCAACAICAICAICGTINGAAGVLGLAGVISFVSLQNQNVQR